MKPEISDLEGIEIKGGQAEMLAQRLRDIHARKTTRRNPALDREYYEALVDLHQHLCDVRDSEGSWKLRELIVDRLVWSGCAVSDCTIFVPHSHEPMTTAFLCEESAAQARITQGLPA